MNIRKKYKTVKCLYDWGIIYNSNSGERIDAWCMTVYGKTSEAWVTLYQPSKEDRPEIIRIIFVD